MTPLRPLLQWQCSELGVLYPHGKGPYPCDTLDRLVTAKGERLGRGGGDFYRRGLTHLPRGPRGGEGEGCKSGVVWWGASG